MADQSKNLLEVNELTDLWNELAPAEWKSLPKTYAAGVYQRNVELPDGTIDCRVSPIVPCMVKCAGSEPTKEEIQQLFDLVRSKSGTPVAFLCTLSSIQFPEFPEGDDPTVEAFFKGEFDPSTMTSRVAILIYPAIEETK